MGSKHTRVPFSDFTEQQKTTPDTFCFDTRHVKNKNPLLELLLLAPLILCTTWLKNRLKLISASA